jgi:hypothetical protein
MRMLCGLDQIFQLTVTPSVAIAFSLETRLVAGAISLEALLAFEDIVDPLLQVIENKESVFLTHGLLNILEPGKGLEHYLFSASSTLETSSL